ncbi:MAG TPA: bifunctional lysylphosphatidylglycerol flippase/synthetase MprF [Planctomycetaceae bacterium]|nr:bifunctional lysylphosphatidylglycerol flippase/synthetase MprF [Planctomycetaceae bacterium]
MAIDQQAGLYRFVRLLGPALVLLVLAGALVLLRHELRHYHLDDVRASLRAIPAHRLAACLGLTALNYMILIGYDLIAVRSIGHSLALARVALASFAGFVTSYNFGALLGGTPVRARLYSSWGMSAAEIVRLIVTIGTTFWVGVFTLAGLMFVIDPFPIPEPVHVAISNVRPIGIVLLIIALAYLALPLIWRKPFVWRGHEFLVPRFPILTLQIGVSAADLVVAAASLYVVLPESMQLSYPQFLGVYLLAVVAVIFTHVPGGLGVLELVILTFAAGDSKQEVLAAILAFRVIYYLLPLGVALSLLLGHEWWAHREQARTVAQRAGRALGGMTPMVVALVTMLTGAVLLFSGAVPPVPARLHLLRSLLPLPAVELSHFLASLIGGGLLLLGRGLQRRLDAAWWATVALLAAGAVFALARGLDYEEAIAACVVLAALFASRKRFYRKGSILHPSWTSGWLAAVGIALLCSAWLGWFAHKHVEYRHELWWRFAFDADAPRFLRAQVGVAVLLLGFSAAHLLSGHGAAKPTRPRANDVQEAAGIVARSRRTLAHLALLGDKMLLFNEARTALIMYAIQGRSWISMGDPVGPDEEGNELVWRFRELCDRYDAWPVFYQVEAEKVTMYLDQGFSLLKIGEEARVDASQFTLEGGARKGLRKNRNALQKEGLTFEVVPCEAVPALLPSLRAISNAWLAEKRMAEKGFSLGYFDEDYLRRHPCAIVRRAEEIIAFANVWLGAEKEEFSIDLMRYRPDGPPGLMDYLLVELILWGHAQGYRWFNLGMAPLSGIEAREPSPLWNKLAALLYRHGDRFYGFEGLREYKDKFDPVWKAKYLVARGGLALPRILADLTALIGRKR